MPTKVCILTAGKGSRLEERTKYFNKALLRVGNKAVISHTIEQFPEDTEFVIALGYKGDIVKQYLKMAHSDRNFIFVETDKYSEAGAGPGYAMLQCREHLQEPFYYYACDSLVPKYGYWSMWGGKYWDEDTDITELFVDGIEDWDRMMNRIQLQDIKENWAAFDFINPADSPKYCTLEVKGNRVKSFSNKVLCENDKAFVGVAYIHDHEQFWYLMDQEKETAEGEIQNAGPILSLDLIKAVRVRWYDTGDVDGLKKARAHFKGIQNLDKLDEELYVVGDHVIKYFHNSNISRNRVLRVEHLNGCGPELAGCTNNFYKYPFIEGVDLFKLDEPQKVFRDLLDYTQTNLWSHRKELEGIEKTVFHDVCKKFYYDKTKSRLASLYEKCDIQETSLRINGKQRLNLNELFRRINWDWLAMGIPAKFHGDYNFSNIVYGNNTFKFLDWRQDFGGSIEYGDIYYDFAKMYHSFLFPHPIVKEGKFYSKLIYTDPAEIKTFIEIPYHMERCKDIFEEFLLDNGYDLWKTKLLTAIVLLNMSPLHESPMDEYLYYFARCYLSEVLSEQ